MTSWLLLTGSTAASWWSGSRPPGGRSEETQSKKYEKKLVSAIDRYELLRLFSVSGNKVVAILSAIRQRLFSVQHAVLKRDHHFIKFAEQRHEFGNTEFPPRKCKSGSG